MRIAIIGGGSIGGAFARALIEQKKVIPEHLIIIERNQQTCDELSRELGCYASVSVPPALSEADIVVLSVKPQDFSAVAASLKNFLKSGQILLSMMTGIRVARLAQEFSNHKKIIRCMPNLPFIVGKGFSVCYEPGDLSSLESEKTALILETSGQFIFVDNEDLIDAATALSGSGPGYLCYLMEHYEKAACDLGFSPEQSRKLVSHTLLGTAELLIQTGWPPQQVQSRVASKGGTTEAAIAALEEAEVGRILRAAIGSAYTRAKDLGK